MPMDDELCFVQFIHPGKEHRPDPGVKKKWNESAHKRKFVENKGRCLRNGEMFQGVLRFWSEWEPQSDVIAQITDRVSDGPRFVYKPFYVVPRSYRHLQNTDPFVFGDFFYTGCQQNTSKGPTQLRYLGRGSVILFGSCVGGEFAIDTVFVIDNWVDHNVRDFKRMLWNRVPRTYWEVTIAAWYQDNEGENSCTPCRPNRSCRLYWGATVNNPVDGMFSFFPCSPAIESPRGFARPVVRNPKVITDGLLQGKRLNRGISRHDVKEHWNNVREQVESDWWLGVSAETPERRNTSP